MAAVRDVANVVGVVMGGLMGGCVAVFAGMFSVSWFEVLGAEGARLVGVDATGTEDMPPAGMDATGTEDIPPTGADTAGAAPEVAAGGVLGEVGVSLPSLVKTFNDPIDQNAFLNASGICRTWSSHFPIGAQVGSELNVESAQSPQKVFVNTICWFVMCWSRLHWLLPKYAYGVPQLLWLGEVEATSGGMDERGQNHILMASEVQSVAKTPPPAALKPVP